MGRVGLSLFEKLSNHESGRVGYQIVSGFELGWLLGHFGFWVVLDHLVSDYFGFLIVSGQDGFLSRIGSTISN
jgi:hypothetical protein